MSRPIVFVDTNTVDNRGSATAFLGGRSDLEKIAKKADIALPRVVYDEIRRHLGAFLRGQRDSFKKNPYKHLLGVDDAGIDNIDHETIISDLEGNESIAYEVVGLQDEFKAYREAYRHAIEGRAPFESSGDKGFKDTLIAKTIDQFCLANPKREVFLLTKDTRLSDYFQGSKVQVIDGFQAFDREYSENKLEEESVLNRIWDYFDEAGVLLPERGAPDNQWLNYEGDIVAYFKGAEHGDVYLLVDATAREPLSFIGESPGSAIKELGGVSSFQGAHNAIIDIDYVFAYLGLDDIKTVSQIMLTNDQIYGIGTDDDISQFAAKLFSALDENGETKLAEEVKERYELKLLTQEQKAQLPF